MNAQLAFLKENWYLVLAAVIFLGVGVFGLMGDDASEEEARPARGPVVNTASNPRLEAARAAAAGPRIDKREKTRRIIDDYERQIQEDVHSGGGARISDGL